MKARNHVDFLKKEISDAQARIAELEILTLHARIDSKIQIHREIAMIRRRKEELERRLGRIQSESPSPGITHTAVALLVAVAVAAGGCQNMSRTAKGGTIGGAAGGVLGGVIGKQAGNTTAGIIIGAAVGGAAGAAIGRYMDKQAAEIQQDLKNARVERIGEGIKITFDTGILFDVDRSDLRAEARRNLSELSQTLQKYDDTEILIQGHTDATGAQSHNQALSENRAMSVSRELREHGIGPSRIQVEGMGESQPVGSNDSVAGRQENRRVEVAIYANDRLKRAAKDGRI